LWNVFISNQGESSTIIVVGICLCKCDESYYWYFTSIQQGCFFLSFLSLARNFIEIG